MKDCISVVDDLLEISEELKDSRLITLSKFLSQRINNPDTFLVILGENCGGKSTLINSLIGKEQLPVSGVPSTGTVAEIFFDEECDKDSYYAINTDASMEIISEEQFRSLAVKPDSELERLRFRTPRLGKKYKGIRIFDTPGYGSIIKEHDTVLTDFIPNADAIVYVVSYRMGFQENDYEFLKGLLDLTREGIPFYLLINRCPKGTNKSDCRVKEIYDKVTAFLQKPGIEVKIIESFENDYMELSAPMSEFFDRIVSELNNEKRQNDLNEAFCGYTQDLIDCVKAEVERKLRNKMLSEEAKENQVAAARAYKEKLIHACETIVKPGFDKIRQNIPAKIEASRYRIENKTIASIDEQSKLTQQETETFIKKHELNFNTQNEVKEIQFYLETELNAIDKQVNDYLNRALADLERDLRLNDPNVAYKAGLRFAKDGMNRFLNAGLLSYFAKFGGRGGTGAGVANAASHALKKLGDLFGKTFSKETHNALKHLLKKLGLTSKRILSAYLQVIFEVVTFVVEVNIWKPMLRKRVRETTESWATEMQGVIIEELKTLEEENINTLNEIAKQAEEAFAVNDDEWEESFSVEFLKEKMDKLEEMERMVA